MTKILNNEVSSEEIVSEVTIESIIKGGTNTSSIIRNLHSFGLKQNEIYKVLKEHNVTTKVGGEIRYQHVRNVLVTQLTTK